MGKRTVYILGAGFSAGARFPTQDRVLELLFQRISYSLHDLLPSDDEREFQNVLHQKIENVSSFVKKAFPTSDQALEDIFTLLDQTISSRGQFLGYKQDDLWSIRRAWIDLIASFFHALSARHLESSVQLYQRFAVHLLEKRVLSGGNRQSASVISLNWDSLVEDALYKVLTDIGGTGKADVDYCVYTTPLDDSPHMPSTKQRAAGLFNVKLLKLHGSINWLRCPNSNLLYTGLGASSNPYQLYLRDRPSPFVEQFCADETDRRNPPLLEPYLITPTYAKVFDQPHIQTTWHNAYVELREAEKIVFIGYSLPEADYHFRTLLRRAIRRNAEIELILYKNDRPLEEDDTYEIKRETPQDSGSVARYYRLFGRERLHNRISFEGVESFVESMLPEDDFPKRLEQVSTILSQHKTHKDYKV